MAKVEVRVSVDLDVVRACIESADGLLAQWATVAARIRSEEEPFVCEVFEDADPRNRREWPLRHLQVALGVMAARSPRQFARFLDGSADASTGDCLVQCAVLGERRYG